MRDLSALIPSRVMVHNARWEQLPLWAWPPSATPSRMVWYAGEGPLPKEEVLQASKTLLDGIWVPTA